MPSPGNQSEWSTLHCKADAENCYSSAPTFWTRVKLAAVTTYGQRLQGSTDLFLVDKWELHQSFPKHRTDTHPPLWLESIRRTGYAAPDSTGKQDNSGTSLPDVSFIANVVDMPNRVATSLNDHTPDFDRLRVETIRTETGGEIYVDYSAPCPVGSSHPSPETNTTRCFPTKWSPDPDLEKPPVEWFNKYVVEKIVEKDRVAREPDVTTQYFYGTPVLDGSGQPVIRSRNRRSEVDYDQGLHAARLLLNRPPLARTRKHVGWLPSVLRRCVAFAGRRKFVRFRVFGMRRRVDHPAVSGLTTSPCPSEVRERGPASGAHGVRDVCRGPGSLGRAVAAVGRN